MLQRNKFRVMVLICCVTTTLQLESSKRELLNSEEQSRIGKILGTTVTTTATAFAQTTCFVTVGTVTTCTGKKKRAIDTGPIQAFELEYTSDTILPASVGSIDELDDDELFSLLGYDVLEFKSFDEHYDENFQLKQSEDQEIQSTIANFLSVRSDREAKFLQSLLYLYTTTSTVTSTNFTSTVTVTLTGCTPATSLVPPC